MAEHVALSHPEIKVLFMSGYDDGVLNRRDAMANSRMVHKPFSMRELVGTVREVLDGAGT
jgi:DNA-binding response OmpR family regulator